MNKLRIIFVLILCIILYSCSSGDAPPDYSTVPPAYDTTNVNAQVLGNGILYYQIETGNSIYSISGHDSWVSLYYTARLKDGTIIASSYADNNTEAVLRNLNLFSDGITQGLGLGMIGMKAGGKRTISIPSKYGFMNTLETSIYYIYRNEDIIYDVELEKLTITNKQF